MAEAFQRFTVEHAHRFVFAADQNPSVLYFVRASWMLCSLKPTPTNGTVGTTSRPTPSEICTNLNKEI
jgi:hypothetical protein